MLYIEELSEYFFYITKAFDLVDHCFGFKEDTLLFLRIISKSVKYLGIKIENKLS